MCVAIKIAEWSPPQEDSSSGILKKGIVISLLRGGAVW